MRSSWPSGGSQLMVGAGVTVVVRWVPCLSVRCGMRVARPARTTVGTTWATPRPAPNRQRRSPLHPRAVRVHLPRKGLGGRVGIGMVDGGPIAVPVHGRVLPGSGDNDPTTGEVHVSAGFYARHLAENPQGEGTVRAAVHPSDLQRAVAPEIEPRLDEGAG